MTIMLTLVPATGRAALRRKAQSQEEVTQIKVGNTLTTSPQEKMKKRRRWTKILCLGLRQTNLSCKKDSSANTTLNQRVGVQRRNFCSIQEIFTIYPMILEDSGRLLKVLNLLEEKKRRKTKLKCLYGCKKLIKNGRMTKHLTSCHNETHETASSCKLRQAQDRVYCALCHRPQARKNLRVHVQRKHNFNPLVPGYASRSRANG